MGFMTGQEPELDRDWMDTIRRRVREVEQGEVECRPVEEVLARLRGKLEAKRKPPSRDENGSLSEPFRIDDDEV